jgi:hypothetical protein
MISWKKNNRSIDSMATKAVVIDIAMYMRNKQIGPEHVVWSVGYGTRADEEVVYGKADFKHKTRPIKGE